MELKKYAALGIGSFIVSLTATAGPSRIVDLSASPTNGGIILTWTAPTNSGTATLTNIDVRYDINPINSLNWSNKTQITWLTDPGALGTGQMAIITDLTPNTAYFFAISVQDSDGIWSTMSNLALATAGDTTYAISVAWDPSRDGSVTNYFLYIGSMSGTYDISTNLVGNVTVTPVVGVLRWGFDYFFNLTAVGNDRESDPAGEISYYRP